MRRSKFALVMSVAERRIKRARDEALAAIAAARSPPKTVEGWKSIAAVLRVAMGREDLGVSTIRRWYDAGGMDPIPVDFDSASRRVVAYVSALTAWAHRRRVSSVKSRRVA